MKIGSSVVFAKELHSNDGKNIDNDKQDEGEVPQGSECRDDDAEQNTHRPPRLSQLQYPQLMEEIRTHFYPGI